MAQFVANRCHVPIRREVTDTLVDLLIDMIHHVGFKAEQRATKELVDEITRVANKRGILRRMAETALDHPDGIIKEVLFPVVDQHTLQKVVVDLRAGFQLPAGTVEANEPHADAAAREAREEIGLLDLPPGRILSAVQETLPDDHFLITSTTRVYSRPDLTSFDWASIRNGILVRVHHVGPAFAHVTYAERDPHTEPAAVSFQITGWVPTGVITRQVTRSFYHFPYHGQTPATWSVDTDNHRFRLFWVPLDQLPPIVAPQRWWVDILTQCLATT